MILQSGKRKAIHTCAHFLLYFEICTCTLQNIKGNWVCRSTHRIARLQTLYIQYIYTYTPQDGGERGIRGSEIYTQTHSIVSPSSNLCLHESIQEMGIETIHMIAGVANYNKFH